MPRAREGSSETRETQWNIAWWSSQPAWDCIQKSGEKTGDITGENTGDNIGDNTGNNTGDNTGDNTGENTGDNIGDNTGENTGDNTSFIYASLDHHVDIMGAFCSSWT